MLLRELHAITEKERLDEITRRGFLKGAGVLALGGLMGLMSKTAHAEAHWVKFWTGKPTNKGYVVWYYDPSSIIKTHDGYKIWTHIDVFDLKDKGIAALQGMFLVNPTEMTYKQWSAQTNKWSPENQIAPDDEVFVRLAKLVH